MKTKLLLLSTSMLGALACAMPAAAQSSPSEDGQSIGLDEIVVTSQRREQSQQEVPVSVTTFSGEVIEQQNIKSATDYLAATPNVSYTEDGQFGKRSAGISVRGVNNLVTGENASIASIGVYVDEFSVASVPNQFANPQLPDMARIEVLRGPQGTYFGRNSVGGVLNLTTESPKFENGGSISVGAETYKGAGEQYSITGVGNLAASDTFALRGVVHYEDNSGYVSNICATGASATDCPIATANGFTPNGAKNSGHEYLSLRLKGLWEPTDATTVTGTFIYGDEKQGHDENVPSGFLDIDSAETFGITEAIDPGTGFFPNNQNLLSHDLAEQNDITSTIGILNVGHEINENLKLKWVTGIIDSEFDRLFDNDLVGGLDALGRRNLYSGTSWSTELRLEGNTGALTWVVGGIYSKDEQEQLNNVFVSTQSTASANGVGLLPPFPEGLGLLLNEKQFSVEGIAVFADATVSVSDDLEVFAGGRYSNDKVRNDFAGNGIGPTCCFPGSPGFPGGPGFDFFQSFANSARPVVESSGSFDDFAPRAGFRYQANDDVNIYGTVSKGYKAGGTSVGNDTTLPGSPALALPFNKETVWNYELGFKSELFDNRVRLNAAAFILDWNDIQFESFRFLTPGDLSSLFEETINVTSAQAKGFEAEFIGAVTENFILTANIGILDSEISHDPLVFLTGGYQVNLDGLELPKAPEFSASLSGEYRQDVANGEGWVRLEYNHKDGQYSDIEGLTNRQTRGPSPASGIARVTADNEFPYLSPGFDVVNLRAGWEGDRVGVTVYVQNLFEEDYYTGTQENFGASGIRLRPHPRVMGANLTYNFD